MKRFSFGIIVWIVTLLAVGTYFSTIVFADEFDSAQLRKVWTLDNPNAANTWSLTEVPGWFRFNVLAHQDTWADRGLMPLLLQTAPKGDFSMETHVKIDNQLDSTYGCLVVWKGPGEWIHLELIFDATRNGAHCEYWPGGIRLAVANIDPDEVYLKIDYVGGVWNLYYKLAEKDDWTFLDKTIVKYEYPYQVGIGAKTWGANPVVADFDYFRCPELGEAQAVEPYSKLATAWAKIKTIANYQ